MNDQVRDVLFTLLRAYATGTSILTDEQKNTVKNCLAPLYSLSTRHDLAHLLGYALFEEGLADGSETYAAFEKQHMLAVFRYEGFAYELARMSDALEQAEIPFIVLKGSVLRDLYPEPWMRTSCDIDVLVHPEHLAAAEAYLTEHLGYRRDGDGPHDVTLVSEGGVHIELHFALVEEGRAGKSFNVLQTVWEHAAPKSGCRYASVLSDEMFYFYHVAHMAKHFAEGGCGVRSFLDLWFLETCVAHDDSARNALLEKGELMAYADAARKLCRAWFSGDGSLCEDALLERMERFVLFGGVYGSRYNYVTIRQKKKGGKLGYFFSRVFIPYKEMKYIYPVLKKCPILLPAFWVWRWIDHLRRGGARRSLWEIKTNHTLLPEERDATARMLQTLGL